MSLDHFADKLYDVRVRTTPQLWGRYMELGSKGFGSFLRNEVGMRAQDAKRLIKACDTRSAQLQNRTQAPTDFSTSSSSGAAAPEGLVSLASILTAVAMGSALTGFSLPASGSAYSQGSAASPASATSAVPSSPLSATPAPASEPAPAPVPAASPPAAGTGIAVSKPSRPAASVAFSIPEPSDAAATGTGIHGLKQLPWGSASGVVMSAPPLVLGEGGSSVVYAGKYGNLDVALKQFDASNQSYEAFLAEVSHWSKL